MRYHHTSSGYVRAFTMIDLMIVVAIIGILFFFLKPSGSGCKARAPRINCVSNLKQVGTGMRMFANDCGGSYPPFNATNEAWNYFQMDGDQLSAPKVLICPADKVRISRKAPVDFDEKDLPTSFRHSSNRNTVLSYFYGVDASDTDPGMILSGDRNITTNAAMLTGFLSVNTNAVWTFTKDMHDCAGNIGLADGSVQQVTRTKLQQLILAYTNATQRIILP